MNIWLVSPAWRRYSITRLALAERRWLCDELAARGLRANSVIVADDDNLDIAHEFGFPTVEMDNTDLSGRFNAGYRFAADQGADIFVHVGSDDWIHPDAFRFLHDTDLNDYTNWDPEPDAGEAIVWSRAPTIMAQRKLALIDLFSRSGCRCEVETNHYGCIPWFLPRTALEPYRFAPIKPGLMRGIDGALVAGISGLSPNWEFQADADHLWLVDFKSDTNVTDYKILTLAIGRGEEEPLQMLATAYPSWLVDLAAAELA